MRLEQGSRAILPNATRLTHRVSESTNEASQQRPGTRPNLPPTGRRVPPPPTRKPADWIPELQAPDDCVTQKPGRLPGSATLPGRLPGVIALPRSKCGNWPANSDSERLLTRIRTSPGAYLNSPLSCGPIPGLYLLKPGSLPTGSPTCQPRQARHKPIPSTHLDLPPLF